MPAFLEKNLKKKAFFALRGRKTCGIVALLLTRVLPALPRAFARFSIS